MGVQMYATANEKHNDKNTAELTMSKQKKTIVESIKTVFI